MKKRTKMVIICLAAMVRTATTVVLLLALLFVVTDLPRILWYYQRWTPSASKEFLNGVSGEFGPSDNPAFLALEQTLADGTGILECSDSFWFLYAPDRSIRLQAVPMEYRGEDGGNMGYSYYWTFALDMTSFYAAALHEGYWNHGYFHLSEFLKSDIYSHMVGPIDHDMLTDGYVTYGIDSYSESVFTEEGAPDFVAALSASLELISEVTPGIYRMELS